MGKIQFGSFVTDMRGKVGGSIYSKNAFGSYVKNKTIPINPNTPAQQAARAQFATVSQDWANLTRAQKRAWGANAINYQQKDVFGKVYTPSGFGMFMSLNGNLSTVGAEKLVAPPSITPPPDMYDFNMDADISATAINVFETGMAVPADTAWVITMTPQVNNSVNTQFVAKSKIAIIPAGTQLANVNLWADYLAKFGLPIANMKAGFEVWPVNTLNGVIGYKFTQECYFGT